MAEFKATDFINEVKKFNRTSLRRVAYKTGFDLAMDMKRKFLPDNFKKSFQDPVPFTVNSVLFKAEKKPKSYDIFFRIKDEKDIKGKFNQTPAEYLYPRIGTGSKMVFQTRFQKSLIKYGYMNRGDQAYPNFKNSIIGSRVKNNQRLSPAVYGNTLEALKITKNGKFKGNKPKYSVKISSTPVFAVKQEGQSRNSKLKPGIYKVKNKSLSLLFAFAGRASIKTNRPFQQFVDQEANEHFKNYFDKSFEKYAKSL